MLASEDHTLKAVSLLLFRVKVGINITLGANYTWPVPYLKSSAGRSQSQAEALCLTGRQCKEKKYN